MYVLAVVNQKGGVGKTTTAANLANEAAERGLDVLLVDIDPQGSATRLVDATPREAAGPLGNTVQLTVSDALYATQAYASQTPVPGKLRLVTVPSGQHWSERLSVAPANLDIATRGDETFDGATERLAHALADDAPPDLVVIDCPPMLGRLLVMALHAADGVLVVSEPADGSVEGIGRTMAAVEQVRRSRAAAGAPEGLPAFLGVIVSNVPPRELRAAELVELLHERYGALVLDTIPRRSVVRQAEAAGAPVSAYSPREAGPVQEAYARLTDHLLRTIALPVPEGA